jgi:hypothetical protein
MYIISHIIGRYTPTEAVSSIIPSTGFYTVVGKSYIYMHMYVYICIYL